MSTDNNTSTSNVKTNDDNYKKQKDLYSKNLYIFSRKEESTLSSYGLRLKNLSITEHYLISKMMLASNLTDRRSLNHIKNRLKQSFLNYPLNNEKAQISFNSDIIIRVLDAIISINYMHNIAVPIFFCSKSEVIIFKDSNKIKNMTATSLSSIIKKIKSSLRVKNLKDTSNDVHTEFIKFNVEITLSVYKLKIANALHPN